MRDGTTEGKTYAAGTLHNLAINDPNKAVIVREGAVVPLIQVAKLGSVDGKRYAQAALRCLARDPKLETAIIAAGWSFVPDPAPKPDFDREPTYNPYGK